MDITIIIYGDLDFIIENNYTLRSMEEMAKLLFIFYQDPRGWSPEIVD